MITLALLEWLPAQRRYQIHVLSSDQTETKSTAASIHAARIEWNRVVQLHLDADSPSDDHWRSAAVLERSERK